ncbi:MAG: hypothetical protein NVSMB42_05140 [Herpetosiphon sp.]
MKYVVFVVVGIIVVVFTIFALQNPALVDVRFLSFQSGQVPLYGIILLSTLTGMLIVGLLNIPGSVQRRFESRRLRQQIADLDRQVTDLKARVPEPIMRPLPDEGFKS